jgi:hypothetical protein
MVRICCEMEPPAPKRCDLKPPYPRCEDLTDSGWGSTLVKVAGVAVAAALLYAAYTYVASSEEVHKSSF